ncbi:MAG: hypothetical protein KDC38_17355, partial [Planctomycetes bacterium]|nr:hypothetical protein [Planctomycetota bacterium]
GTASIFRPVSNSIRLLPSLTAALVASFAGTALDAANAISLTTGVGAPGTTAFMEVLATNDVEIQGFSIALTFDESLITPADLAFDGTITEVVLGGPPDFAATNVGTSTMTAGVVLDLDPTSVISIPVSASDPQSIARLQWVVDPGLVPAGQLAEVVLRAEAGDPLVATAFSSFGSTVTPQLGDSGGILVANDFRFSFPNTSVVAGTTTQVVISCDHPFDLEAFQVSLVWDTAQLTVHSPGTVAMGAGYFAGLSTGTILIDFVETSYNDALPPPDTGLGGFAVAAIFDAVPPFGVGQILPAGLGTTLIRVPFDVAPGLSIGTCPTFEFRDAIPTIGLDNLTVVLAGTGVFPTLDGGTVCVAAEPEFRRGDANTSGGVDISDAIFLLDYLFASGAPPQCVPAADVNDDESTDISDAIFLLEYLFSLGAFPPAPGPDACGPDPTPSVPCASYVPTC